MRTRSLALVMGTILLMATPMLLAQGRGPGSGGGSGPYGGGGGTGGGEPTDDEGFGNNLAVPVVFAEGFGLGGLPTGTDTGLRPTASEVVNGFTEYWDASAIFVKDGVTYYPQQTASYWRAQWRDGNLGEPVIINWSDNLINQYWTKKSLIRVEVVMEQTPLDMMNAYTMAYLFGKGTTEMWGATGTVYPSTYRTVYSSNARITIQKLVGPGGAVDTTVPAVTSAVYENYASDGPGAFGAEVNVSGKLIYGFQWALGQWSIPDDLKVGWWRLTFSVDPVATYSVGGVGYSYSRNVLFAGLDPADQSAEAMFNPSLPDDATSVLEVQILERRTGRKPTSPGRGGKPTSVGQSIQGAGGRVR